MTRSGRAGPLLFCSCRKVGKRQAQGSFTPLRIPGPKWGAGRPPLGNPQVLAGAVNLAELLAASRLELRCRWGKLRARARSPRPPHLHRFGVGASAPLPPKVPKRGKSADHARLGAAPLAPAFPQRGKSADHARSAWHRVRNGFCGNAFANLRGSSCRVSG